MQSLGEHIFTKPRPRLVPEAALYDSRSEQVIADDGLHIVICALPLDHFIRY